MRGKWIINLKSFFWAVILACFIMQEALAQYIPIVGFMDEMMAICFFIYYIYKVLYKGISKTDAKIIMLMVLLSIIGFLGNQYSEIQNNIIYCLYDLFNILKFIFAILGAVMYFRTYKNKEEIIVYLSKFVKILVSISSICMLLNFIVDIGMHTDYRYGIRAFNFIYSRVGAFYSICIVWLLILTAYMYYRKSIITNIYIFLVLLNMCSTLRSRAFAFAVLYIILYYILLINKTKKMKWWYIPPIIVLLFLIANDQITYYFSGDRARNILLKFGVLTARNYFPLGSGLATYGTAIAKEIYSPLYSKYGFSGYWGLSKNFGDFLTDNYWPAILGEFGVLGTLITIILLGAVTKKLVRITNNKYSKLCVYFAMTTLFISSLASSSFFACTQLMIFVCLICNLTKKDIS